MSEPSTSVTAAKPGFASAPIALSDTASDPASWRFLYGSVRGRVGRLQFWRYAVLVPIGLSLVASALLGIAGLNSGIAQTLVQAVGMCLLATVSAKRWQDSDRTAWWVLILLIPVGGLVWTLLDNGLRRGTPGPNRYGLRP